MGVASQMALPSGREQMSNMASLIRSSILTENGTATRCWLSAHDAIVANDGVGYLSAMLRAGEIAKVASLDRREIEVL